MIPTTHRLPTRRPDLLIRPIGDRGRFVVKDLRSGAYFQIGQHEEFLLSGLDGRQSALALRRGFERQFGEPLSDHDLGEFLEMAKAQEFLAPANEVDAPAMGERTAALLGFTAPGRDQPADEPPPAPVVAAPTATPTPTAAPAPAAALPSGQSLLNWRKSLFNPDRLFTRLVPWLGFLWTRGFLAVSLLAVAVALWVVVSNWSDLLTGFDGALRWETALLVWVVMLAATTLHEFAHGLTLKKYGGQVPELGVLVMYLIPCLFCNVSDAWLIRERWKRMLVTLAGGYCDLCLWAAAVFVWRLTPPDALVNYLAFVTMTVLGGRVFFNFNPFIKLDGYYLLGDWLEVPNLLQRGQDRAKAHLRRVLWGAAPPPAEPNARALTVYGLCSWLYGLAFLGTAVYALVRALWGWLGPAGVAVAVGLAVVLLKHQFGGLNAGEVKAMLASRRVRTAFWLLLLGGLIGGAFVPVSDRAGGAFRVRGGGRVELRSPAAAVLREVYFDEGDEVPPGAVVARLEVPDLASRRTRLAAAAAEARAKLALLQAGPGPTAVRGLTERVARAKAWHQLAESDLVREKEAQLKEVARREAAIGQAKAELQQAEVTLDRLTRIRGQGAVGAGEYDTAAARVGVCRGLVAQAEADQAAAKIRGLTVPETELARRAKELSDVTGELALLTAGPRAEEVEALRASVARADEEVRFLDEVAGKLTLKSARGGLITTARLKERVGRLFQDGELICEVEDATAMEVEVLVKEGQTARVEAGQEVELLARALPFQALTGRVQRVAPAVRRPGDRGDGSSPSVSPAGAGATDAEGLTAVYCALDDGTALRPGMTGHARIQRGSRPAWMVLSESALRTIRVEFWK